MLAKKSFLIFFIPSSSSSAGLAASPSAAEVNVMKYFNFIYYTNKLERLSISSAYI